MRKGWGCLLRMAICWGRSAARLLLLAIQNGSRSHLNC